MSDKVQKLGHSIIQHGKENNRIYLMKYSDSDRLNIINQLDEIAKQHKYTKIVAKVPEKVKKLFIDNKYKQEAFIPNYCSSEVYVFMCKYFEKEREKLIIAEIEQVLQHAKIKSGKQNIPILPQDWHLKSLHYKDASNMACLYKKVFKTYPFPIHDEEYLKSTMKDNVNYFGIYKQDKLIAISSSETDKECLNCEMTDLAILPEYRGQNYSLVLLSEMEQKLKKQKFKVLYTIARAKSYSTNIAFSKLNYLYGGTLINNTNICGSIESMNVWHKEI